MQTLSFQSQKLKVDFITLTLPNSDDEQKLRNVANYFYNLFGFNSFLSDGNTRRIVETLYQDTQTKDTLIIRMNYWNQTVVEFHGKSGEKFYQLFKSNLIDWDFLGLSSFRLSRIDICYEQKKSDSFDTDQFDKFLVDSRKHILKQTRTQTTKLLNNSRGRILGINKRSNPRYYRVYDGNTQIRFELEIKKPALDSVQDYFFKSQFDLFESNLTNLYFHYSITLFPLDNYFVSWLMDFNRKYIRNKNYPNSALVTEYLKNKNHLPQHDDDERMFHLLQFLNFIKTLKHQNSSRHFVEGKKYIIQEFYLTDFMKFTGMPIKQTRRTKIISYFQILHKAEPIIEQFSDGRFCIFASFLFSGVKKIANRWIVKVYIIEDLYNYAYPFILSKSFTNYQNKTDCLLKLKIIKLISVPTVKKIFPLSEFLQQLKLSNSKIVQVKKDLKLYLLIPKEK